VTATLLGFQLADARGAMWFVAQLFGAIYTPASLREFGFGSYNGALWTIPIELQFYFLVPLVFLLLRRSARPTTTLFALHRHDLKRRGGA
jgi:peptidoglycan/LPS O-acetylase OafA/YrhL